MSKKNRNKDLSEFDDSMLDEELLTAEEGGNSGEASGDSPSQKGSRRRRLMISLLNNEGENNITNFKDLYKSVNLNGEWFKKNLSFILTITACLLIFVTNRYQAQQEQIEEARLKKELTEMKYKWLTRFSELTSSTRQSRIEDKLKQIGDTALTHSKLAPFIIRASK